MPRVLLAKHERICQMNPTLQTPGAANFQVPLKCVCRYFFYYYSLTKQGAQIKDSLVEWRFTVRGERAAPSQFKGTFNLNKLLDNELRAPRFSETATHKFNSCTFGHDRKHFTEVVCSLRLCLRSTSHPKYQLDLLLFVGAMKTSRPSCTIASSPANPISFLWSLVLHPLPAKPLVVHFLSF